MPYLSGMLYFISLILPPLSRLVHQLCDNPYDVDGYVMVKSFAARRVIFSFNRCQESEA